MCEGVWYMYVVGDVNWVLKCVTIKSTFFKGAV